MAEIQRRASIHFVFHFLWLFPALLGAWHLAEACEWCQEAAWQAMPWLGPASGAGVAAWLISRGVRR